jgi:hypothetical protein
VASSRDGRAGLRISPITPCGCSRTRTPAVAQRPSTGKASSSGPAAPVYPAGVNPSRNRVLAASENGPRAVSVNVAMPAQLCRVTT